MILEQVELKYKDKVVFTRLVMSAKFKRVPKLFAEDEACFLFLTKGAFLFRTPTKLLRFSEGDALLSKCGNYFIENASVNNESTAEIISAVGAFFYPAMVKGFFVNDLSLNSFQDGFDAVKANTDPLMKSFVESLNYMLDNPALADDNLIVTKLKELLLLLSRSEGSESINEFVLSLFNPAHYDFKEIIQKNIFSNLALTDLAFLCNMSLATFKRKFSVIYSTSPARYFQIKRLEKAQHLLEIDANAISDIAFECGFQTVAGFDKVFKKHFSTSPSQYRMSRLENQLSR